jgi:hypothetical protein
LSSDAIALLLGAGFGLIAGLGATLLVLLARQIPQPPPPAPHHPTMPQATQPPIFILVAGQEVRRLEAPQPAEPDAAWWADGNR